MNTKLYKTFKYAKGTLFIALLAALFTATFRLGLASMYEGIIDHVVQGNGYDVLKSLAILLLFILMIDFAYAIKITFSKRSSNAISKHIRTELLSNLMHKSQRDMDSLNSGQVSTLLQSDIDNVSFCWPYQINELIFGLFQSSLGLYYCFNVSSFLTFIVLVSFGIGAFFNRYFNHKMAKIYEQQQKLEEDLHSFLSNRLKHDDITTIYQLEMVHVHDLNNQHQHYQKQLNQFSKLSSFYSCCGLFFGNLSSILLIIMGLSLIKQNAISVGNLFGFLQMSNVVFWPFYFLPKLLTDFTKARVSMQRINEIEHLVDEEVSDEFEVTDTLKLDNVSFEYIDDIPVIKDFSCNLKCGEVVGISGSSGAGKSTLLKLILTLYKPTKGSIQGLNRGIPLSINALRNNITYIPQESILVGADIQEAVLSGMDSNKEELDSWIRKVFIDFDHEFQLGLNQPLGLDDVGISGGQAQRLSIVRALLRERNIIVMDEPTSALDEHSEQKIIELINELAQDKLVILVTHSKKVLACCDRIITL